MQGLAKELIADEGAGAVLNVNLHVAPNFTVALSFSLKRVAMRLPLVNGEA